MTRAFFISAALLLFACGAVVSLGHRGQPTVVATNLERLPYEIAGFTATDDAFDAGVYEELNADLHIYRHYRDVANRQVDLYIGYYGTAKGGRTPHNPYACLPGAGWAILERGEVDAQVSYAPRQVSLNYVLSEKSNVRQVMIHWYQSAGTKILASGLQQNLRRFQGRIFNNCNDGAYVQLSAHAGESEDEVARTIEMLDEFARELLELLPAYWPVEE